MDEVNGEDAAGLRGQELLPRWARAAGCGVVPAACRVATPWSCRSGGRVRRVRLARDGAPTSDCRSRCGSPGPDRGCGRRSSGSPPAGVVPFARGQSPVPGEQRCRGHHEHLAPPAAGDEPGQCRKPHPVARLVADPAGLAAQYRVLVPEYQEFGVLGHLTPGQYHQTTEQTANKQVDDRKDHSAMTQLGCLPKPNPVNEPTEDLGTQSDCPVWFPFAGHIVAGPYHQVLGEGCVYPGAVQTLGNQLSTAGRSWAAYLQDMGNDPGPGQHGQRGARACLRSSRHLGHRSHSESRKGRSVRRPPRRVHVLPLGHRQPGLLRRAHPVIPAAAGRPDPG